MGKRIEYQAGQQMLGTRLSFVEEIPRTHPKSRRGRFRCSCGNTVEVNISDVVHKNTTSCGCLRSELAVEKNTKHGQAQRAGMTKAYQTWQGMHQRCGIKENYLDIAVCEEWSGESGFQQFYADMGDRPVGMSIDRIDGSKGYFKENCRWATPLQQANNLRTNVFVEIDGVTNTQAEWCRIYGIGRHVVRQRMSRGFSRVEAITTPLNKAKQGRAK